MTPTFPTVRKYRKRPIVVEAFQWLASHGVGQGVLWNSIKGHYYVVTIHGQETIVNSGDWIIMELDFVHHYPCKPDVFAATYEEVT